MIKNKLLLLIVECAKVHFVPPPRYIDAELLLQSMIFQFGTRDSKCV